MSAYKIIICFEIGIILACVVIVAMEKTGAMDRLVDWIIGR
jgi:hypothetical protein